MHTPNEVLEHALEHGHVISLDFETRGPDAKNPLHTKTVPTLYSLASGSNGKYKGTAVRCTEASLQWLRDNVLKNSELKVVMHNESFDLKICHRFVLPQRKIRATIIDTMVLAWIYDNRGANVMNKPFSLKNLSKKFLGHEMNTLANIFKDGPLARERKDLEKRAIKLRKDWLKMAKRHERRIKAHLRRERDLVLARIRLDDSLDRKAKAELRKRANAVVDNYNYNYDRAEQAAKRLTDIYRIKHLRISQQLTDLFVRYAVDDAIVTQRLYWKFRKTIKQRKLLSWTKVELINRLAATDMELAGISVNPQVIQELHKIFEEDVETLKDDVFRLAGEYVGQDRLEFQLNSNREVSLILHTALQAFPDKDKVKLTEAKASVIARQKWAERAKRSPKEQTEEPTPYFSVAKRVLTYTYDTKQPGRDAKLQHPVVTALMKYRVREKLRSTYTKKLSLVNGKLHAYFRSSGTDTGRYSSAGPNLQNIPSRDPIGKKIRDAFEAQSGWKLIVADLSQIELRIAAILCNEPTLLKVYSEYRDMPDGGRDYSVGDVHETTRSNLDLLCPFDVERALAKIANFALLYGMIAESFGLAFQLEPLVAEQVRNAFFQTYSAIEHTIEKLKQIWRAGCRTYRIPFSGRRRVWNRHFTWVDENGNHRREDVHVSPGNLLNTIVQGSAADALKAAIWMFYEAIVMGGGTTKYQGKVNLLLQVHDELVLEAEESVAEEIAHLLKYCMEYAYWKTPIPFLSDGFVVDNWGQGKDGHVEILGPDGKPLLNEKGKPQTELLYPEINEGLQYQTLEKKAWAAQFFPNPEPKNIYETVAIYE